MKILKKIHLKSAIPGLIKLGYHELQDTQAGGSGLFVKLIKDRYLLTLGLTISNYFAAQFTGSYYLSKTTRFSTMWGDIPRESYERIGVFLTKRERQSLLTEDFSKDGVVDAWWVHDDSGKWIEDFIATVALTESRFLQQKDLFLKIENSKVINELVQCSQGVMKLINQGLPINGHDYQFVPAIPIDGVPVEWFMAAEIILLERKGILNKNTVKGLALDSWRQDYIRTRV